MTTENKTLDTPIPGDEEFKIDPVTAERMGVYLAGVLFAECVLNQYPNQSAMEVVQDVQGVIRDALDGLMLRRHFVSLPTRSKLDT